MKVGAAMADITPPLGMPMIGYGPARTAGATGVHDPLMARVIVAEGEDGTSVGLVVADLVWVEPRLQSLIAAEVLERTGIPRERLQLAGTHTHSGPGFPEASDVETEIGHKIADAVARAWEQRRPAEAAVGVGEVHGIGANRRPNGGPVDDRVTVARFDGVDGRPIATLVNYGCHPTTLGPDNMLYTADFPGEVCRAVDAELGGVTVFSTGPQGDVNPGGYSPEGSMVGVVVPWRTFESAERYGRTIADCAIAVHRGLSPRPSSRVWGTFQEVPLRRKRLPELEVAREAARVARAAERTVREAELSTDATYHALVAAAYAEIIAAQAADPERDGPVRTRTSVLAIGPLLHIGVQGELFVELGQAIRAALGGDATCIAALCDGSIGYIPPADAFEIGGYEPNASVLQAGEGERLVDAIIAYASGAPAA